MRTRSVTTVILLTLVSSATAQDLQLNPKNGYTQQQTLALTGRFDLYQGQTLHISPSKNLFVASFATCEKTLPTSSPEQFVSHSSDAADSNQQEDKQP